jgi:ABC-type nitrate/sulfonate/bicarbonate transport system substrate-binding protein
MVASIAIASGGTARGAADTLEKPSITLGWGKFAGNDVANRLPEFAKKYGLTINLQPTASGPDQLTALVTGHMDVALLTWTYLFQAQDSHLDVVAIASNIKKGTAIVVNSKLGVRAGDWAGLEALAERRAAAGNKLRFVGARTSINFTLGYLSLKQHGVQIDRLMDIQDVPQFPLHPQLMQQNAADVESTGEPFATQAVLNGSGIFFAYPYDTPAGALNTEFLVMRTFVTKSPATARAFVRAVADTAAYLHAHPAEEIRDVVNYTGLARTIVEAALRNVEPSAQLDLNAAKALASTMYAQKIVQHDYSDDIDRLAYPHL